MSQFSSRLGDAVRAKRSPLCVGLDPRWDSLPAEIRRSATGEGLTRIAEGYARFCREVIDLVAPLVPIIKPQSAFFEACGPAGMMVLQSVIYYAKQLGLLVILDAKRGDIATTGSAYAEASFSGTSFSGQRYPVWAADALTVAPYMGEDSVTPFIAESRKSKGGLFVLVRTSNPGSGLFQNLISDGKPLYRHVAEAVNRWNAPSIQSNGYGDIGAVVGATHPAELAELRAAMPGVWFLVPGYGTQGGSAADVKPAFDSNGLGAIVNSSRGIIFCYPTEATDWRDAIVAAVKKTNAELLQ